MLLPDVVPLGAYDPGVLAAAAWTCLKFSSCRLERSAGALSRVTVEFTDAADDRGLVCRREGPTCVGGDLRLAALATLDAVSQSVGIDLRFELVGVKPLRAFDTNLIVVGILAQSDSAITRAVGTAIAEDDMLGGVARATLHAVNRLVSPRLMTNPPFDR